MKSVTIRYFASLRELAGVENEKIQTQSATYRELYQELAGKYKFELPVHMIQLAVNEEFESLDAQLEEAAKVVFIPPVAGG